MKNIPIELHERSRTGKPIRTKSGWKIQPQDMETPQGVSMTLQNQSYTIRDLLIKHSNGIMVGTEFPTFNTVEPSHEDEDFTKVMSADIFDREIITQNNITKIDSIKSKIEAKHKKPAPDSTPEHLTTTKGGTTAGGVADAPGT